MNKPFKLIEAKRGQTSGISSQSSDGFVSSIAEEILNSPLIVAPFTTPPAPSCSLCRSEFTGVNLVRRIRRRVRRAPEDASRATRAAAGRVAAGNRFNRFSTGSDRFDRFQPVRTDLTGLTVQETLRIVRQLDPALLDQLNHGGKLYGLIDLGLRIQASEPILKSAFFCYVHKILLGRYLGSSTWRINISLEGYSLPCILRHQFINYKIYQVAYAIETEIRAYFDRESVQNLVGTLEGSADEDEKVKVLVEFEFEKRLSQGFDIHFQDLISKAKIFSILKLLLCDSSCSIRIRDQFIRIPLVDELEAHKEIPRIISLLSSENVAIQAGAIDCILGISYYGRREAIEAMLEAELVEKLVIFQRLEKQASVDENGTTNEDDSKSDPKRDKEEGYEGNCPFEGCVARFAVQLEPGEVLSKKEKIESKLEILRRIREASVSEAEKASIVAEVLWGSSP
ncbi:Purple acid phosphatase 26 isoform 1 [Hibiscus syriacus]|uniref:Purple acid phosphatase 26 isoform 1 n=1 Tax=Hibiscus syriacus TaxID=106335 RepID=A0A6A2YU08_HIBSY|nr:Purple acid phosphatase 26 isoform 1 [Hibiscus syriacus]